MSDRNRNVYSLPDYVYGLLQLMQTISYIIHYMNMLISMHQVTNITRFANNIFGQEKSCYKYSTHIDTFSMISI